MELLVEPEMEEEAIVDRSQVITNTPMTVVSIAINNQMLDANLWTSTTRMVSLVFI